MFTEFVAPVGLMLLVTILLILASAMIAPENAADAFFGMTE
jgi:hypothetical protein